MYTYEISQSSPGADPFQSSSGILRYLNRSALVTHKTLANWVAAGLALTLL